MEKYTSVNVLCRACLKTDCALTESAFDYHRNVWMLHIDKLKYCFVDLMFQDYGVFKLCAQCVDELQIAYNLKRTSQASEITYNCYTLTCSAIDYDDNDSDAHVLCDSVATQPDVTIKNENASSNWINGGVERTKMETHNIDIINVTNNDPNDLLLLADEWFNDATDEKVRTKKTCSLPLPSEKENSDAFIGDEKVFDCKICDIFFLSETSLNKHMKSHAYVKKFYKCKYCQKMYLKKSLLKRHEKVHNNEIDRPICDERTDNAKRTTDVKIERKNFIVCKYCADTFADSDSLQHHQVSVHGKYYRCTRCAEKYKNFGAFKKHSKSHVAADPKTDNGQSVTVHRIGRVDERTLQNNRTDSSNRCRNRTYVDDDDDDDDDLKSTPTRKAIHKKQPYQCSKCDESFKYKKVLFKHMWKSHYKTEDEYCKCDVCDKIYANEYVLKRHMRSHTGGYAYKCNRCDDNFTVYKDYRNHKSLCDRRFGRFDCRFCGAEYRDMNKLTTHEVGHEIVAPFKCKHCDERFVDAMQLIKHDVTHADGPEPNLFRCVVCGQSFLNKMALTTHARMHIYNKHYRCNLCNRSYRYWIALRNHMLGHVRKNVIECACCTKRFKTSAAYEVHKKIRTGVKLYKCKACKKIFSKLETVAAHWWQVHSNAKSAVCKLCKKVFKNKALLKAHLLRHHGRKIYSCSYCFAQFKNKFNKTVHEKKHANVNVQGNSYVLGDLTITAL